MWIWRRMLRVSWTEKRTNESVLMEIGLRTCKRRYVAETEGSKTEVDGLWPPYESKWYGNGKWHVGMRRGKKKKRSSDEEVDGGNTHDVRSNLAELKAAVEDRNRWRKLPMTTARALRVDGTR